MTKKMKAKKLRAETLANRGKAIIIDRPGFSPAALKYKGIPWNIFGEKHA